MYHSVTVLFLPWKREFGVSSTAVSLLYGVARLEGGIEGPVAGYFTDRFGPRVVIIIGAGLLGVGLILLTTTHSFLAFFLIYILIVSLGFSAGFYSPVATAVNSWFIRRRAVGFAIITAAGSIGGMVMAPFLSHLILNHGWRTAALIAGVLILVVAIPAALPIHRSPEVRRLYPDGRALRADHAEGSSSLVSPVAHEVSLTVRQALSTLDYWLLALGIILRLLVTVALSIHFVPILVWRGMDEASAAYFVSLFALGTIVTALLMGWMGDRWNKVILCSAGIVPAAAGILGLALSQATAVLYAFPIGLAFAMGTVPLNWSLIVDSFGRRSYGTLRGIILAGCGIATFLSPIYAGWVFDRTGSYAVVLITFSITLLIAASIFAALLHHSRPKGEKLSVP